jgi:hypothetical protein
MKLLSIQTKKIYGSYLLPGEKIFPSLLDELKKINKIYSQKQDFKNYKLAIKNLFNLEAIETITPLIKYYLGGFIEGEGSLNVSAKKNKTSRFGVYFSPEFNITQSVNGISNLYLALCIFETGRIRFKTGSRATFVFTINDTYLLKMKIIPFFEKYINLYGSQSKRHRTKIFNEILIRYQKKNHLTYEDLINEIVPRWDVLRIQIGQSNQTFKTKYDAIDYITNFYLQKQQKIKK